MTAYGQDARVEEFRQALAAFNRGLAAPAGAHDRFKRAIGPYVEHAVEQTTGQPERFRRYSMLALIQPDEFGPGVPLGAVLIAFRATEEEAEWIRRQEAEMAPESVDEQERLRRMPYGLYLRTAHWKAVREAALQRAEYRCTICNRSKNLQVHHRIYDRRGAERPADVSVLCDGCHVMYHDKLRSG